MLLSAPSCLACSDRPACELVPGGERPQDAHHPLLGSLVHCNLRLAPAGLRRLAATVDAAMLRWAAQHRRYDVLPGGGAGEEGFPEAELAAEHRSGGEAAAGDAAVAPSGSAVDAPAAVASGNASAAPLAAAEQQQQQQREGRKQQRHRRAGKGGKQGGSATDR